MLLHKAFLLYTILTIYTIITTREKRNVVVEDLA